MIGCHKVNKIFFVVFCSLILLNSTAFATSGEDQGGSTHSIDLAGFSHIAPLNIGLNQVVFVDLKQYGSNLYLKEVTVSGALNTFGGSWANDIGFQYRSTDSVSTPFGQRPAAGLFQAGNGIGVGPSTMTLEVPFTISNTGEFSILLYDVSYDIAGQPDATWQSGSIDLVIGRCFPADFTQPYGVLDFFDVSEFISKFGDRDSEADINHDGQFDFFDVSSFLIAYSAGCP